MRAGAAAGARGRRNTAGHWVPCAGKRARFRGAITKCSQVELATDLVKRAWLSQCKRRDLGEEALAVLQHHLVRAVHRPEGCLQRAARGVFEALTLAERGLMADHAWATDLFDVARGVGDHPVAIEELHRVWPFVDDGDRVQEEPLVLA